MKLCKDLNEVEVCPMEELSLLEDSPSGCDPGELETEFSIPRLCLFDADNLSKDSCTLLGGSLVNQHTWFQEDSYQSSDQAKAKKNTKSKTIKKTDMDQRKVLKQMRNRISAQRSRDKKKKEMDDLKEEVEKLRLENLDLASQLQAAKQELEQLQQTNPVKKEKKSKGKGMKYKFLLATLLLGYVCMTGCVNPLLKSIGVPQITQKAIMHHIQPAISILTKKDELTSAQRKRKRYIERTSHLQVQENVDQEVSLLNSQDLDEDLIGYEDRKNTTNEIYIKTLTPHDV